MWASAPGERIPRAIRLILRPRRDNPRDFRPAGINTRRRDGLPPFQPRKSRTQDIRQQVNIATAMKRLLLVTILLSTALSENILTGNYPRQTAWIKDKKPNGKTKDTSREDVTSKFDEFSNYDDNRQLSRISDTRFINEPVKLPLIAVVRRPNAAQFLQDGLLSSGKLGNTKPTVLISIGIQERTNVNDDIQEQCSAKKKNHKPNQSWQYQQPFYVEEPQWIEIDSDYMDGPSRSPSEGSDPYILTRGKKIFRIKDPGRLDKMVEDYEEILDYSSIGERLTARNRVRRGVDETDAKFQNNAIDRKNNQEEEMNRYDLFQDIIRDTNKIVINIENHDEKFSKIDEKSDGTEIEKRKNNQSASSVHDDFIKKYEKDKLKNMVKISPSELKFTKQYRTSANSITIPHSVGQEHEIQQKNNHSKIETGNDEIVKTDKRFNNRENLFATDANKRNKRLAFFKNKRFIEDHKKRGNFETEWKNSEAEKKAKLEQMESNPYIDKMEDLNTYDDLFILARGKKPLDNSAKDSNKKDTNKSIETRWKYLSAVEHYGHRKNSETEEKMKDEENELKSDKNNLETGNTRLTSNSNSENSGTKDRPNYRKKRNAYETRSELQRLKNIEKEISFPPYLRPRDKHSKIEERLLLPTDPFFIIRGKKTSQQFEDNLYSIMEPRNEMNDADLLKMLLAKRSSCNDRNYDVSIGKLSKTKSRPRNRRGPFDKILNLETLKYDPFYVVRGKRMNADNFQSNERSEQNQRSTVSESNAAQNDIF